MTPELDTPQPEPYFQRIVRAVLPAHGREPLQAGHHRRGATRRARGSQPCRHPRSSAFPLAVAALAPPTPARARPPHRRGRAVGVGAPMPSRTVVSPGAPASPATPPTFAPTSPTTTTGSPPSTNCPCPLRGGFGEIGGCGPIRGHRARLGPIPSWGGAAPETPRTSSGCDAVSVGSNEPQRRPVSPAFAVWQTRLGDAPN
jgi:hypothetical protein